MTITTDVQFAHLRRLTDAGGLYEHACGTEPRREHGYCVDDVARARELTAGGPAERLRRWPPALVAGQRHSSSPADCAAHDQAHDDIATLVRTRLE